mmetsp:Transcript_13801/g.39632  ORF Transcript_13801/g.39632 Transcript_13801/m.39632 type:complete len:260 (-) Transcript_13801:15-794(-)
MHSWRLGAADVRRAAALFLASLAVANDRLISNRGGLGRSRWAWNSYTPTVSLSRGWTGLYCPGARGPVLRPRRYRQFRPVAEGGKYRQSTIRSSQRPPSPPPTRQIPHNNPNRGAPGGGRGGTGRCARPAGLEAPTSVPCRKSAISGHKRGDAKTNTEAPPDDAAAAQCLSDNARKRRRRWFEGKRRLPDGDGGCEPNASGTELWRYRRSRKGDFWRWKTANHAPTTAATNRIVATQITPVPRRWPLQEERGRLALRPS